MVTNATQTWARYPRVDVWNDDNWQANLQSDQRFREFIKEVSYLVHIVFSSSRPTPSG